MLYAITEYDDGDVIGYESYKLCIGRRVPDVHRGHTNDNSELQYFTNKSIPKQLLMYL